MRRPVSCGRPVSDKNGEMTGRRWPMHWSAGTRCMLFLMFLSVLFQCERKMVTETAGDTIEDIDGNHYAIVQIGDQWWMAENLKVTRYRNGDPVPYLPFGQEWWNLSEGAYGIYDDQSANIKRYGCLYNWYTVNDTRNIAPTGWHVATENEWEKLIGMFGGDEAAGAALKTAGTAIWNPPNTGATNESGFSALPAGFRGANGHYHSLGGMALFWGTVSGSDQFA